MRVKLSKQEIVRRAKQGLALNLRQLAVATGYCYSIVRQWKKDGLPLKYGKITLADACAWLKKFAKIKQQESPASASGCEHHPLLTAGRCG
jgi:hypothetical protein